MALTNAEILRKLRQLEYRVCCNKPTMLDQEAIDALTAPTAGKLVYNTTINKYQFYNGIEWETITSEVPVV